MLHFNKLNILPVYCLVDKNGKPRPNIKQHGIQLEEIMAGIRGVH